MRFKEAFENHYDSQIQLSPFQAQLIGSAIKSRSPGCRLLVFGVGYDTPLWLSLNDDGETHFLESSSEWIDVARAKTPEISVSLLPTFDLTVEKTASLSGSDLSKFPPPRELTQQQWDVIVVDGPPGFSPGDPGRAIAIYWASVLASPSSHVFCDDYERPLEARFANELLRGRPGSSSYVFPASDNIPYRKLFWSAGSPLPTAPSANRPVVLSIATPDYAIRWRFCIDSHYSYCRRLGYEYQMVDPSHYALHPKWAKLEAAVSCLEGGHDVLLIDADAEIDKRCPRFADLFEQSPSVDILSVKGISGRPNSGVLALRGGQSSVAATFLRECLARREEPVPTEDFVTEEGENGHVIWLLKQARFAERSGDLPRFWNCSDPESAEQAYVRHYTNHLRDHLEHIQLLGVSNAANRDS
ncbi:hypothetical protein GGQ99_001277 [Aminobacter niigataensis]|uniref:Polysaccharide biosynthesis domain-containing protein n=1 Tax=Aminobacter niigataensis TaxID=83265 RepID=A0ABR6KYP0_9HYPH|nr:hypothetical protein [Aminobacter niigataensis]